MIDREKLHKMDRIFAKWIIAIAETKDMTDEVLKLCEEIMGEIEKDGDATELVFEYEYLMPLKEHTTEIMGFVKKMELAAKTLYGKTEEKK